jgi:hypothetical protein
VYPCRTTKLINRICVEQLYRGMRLGEENKEEVADQISLVGNVNSHFCFWTLVAYNISCKYALLVILVVCFSAVLIRSFINCAVFW